MDTRAPTQLLGLLLLWLPGATFAIVMTQSEACAGYKYTGTWYQFTLTISDGSVPVCDQDAATYYTPSSTIDSQKPGSTLASGVPSRFKGSGSGTQVGDTVPPKLLIYQSVYSNNRLANCQAVIAFGGGTEVVVKGDPVAPTVLIFPPAADQVATGTVTIVCVANKYFPDVTVTWEVDGTTQTTGIENSKTPQNSADCTYNLSSTLTLTSTQYNSHKEYTCKVTQGTTSVVQSFNRGDC
nr:IgG1 [Oryctolagus cuniculus]